MKILIINPDYGMTQEEMALRCRILEKYTAPDTQLAMVCPQNSGVELNSALDVVLAAPEIVQLAADGQNAGFDAVVLYCFSDPVIDACREALRIPVIGGAQASCMAALKRVPQLWRNTGRRSTPAEKKMFLRTLGVSPERIGQIAAVNLNGISPWADRETTFKKLLACGQKMMRETHTEAIVLGCLSFLGLAEPLSRVLGIPVIDPAVAAVTTAESIVRQRLFTSKVSYPLLCSKHGRL